MVCLCCVDVLYLSPFNPEIQMDFIVPLKDVSVPEKRQAKFECTITKDVSKVMWYKGADIITPDQKYDVISDRKKHMLIINSCEFDDEDEYTIEVLGKTSTARLQVEGKFWRAMDQGPGPVMRRVHSLSWSLTRRNVSY